MPVRLGDFSLRIIGLIHTLSPNPVQAQTAEAWYMITRQSRWNGVRRAHPELGDSMGLAYLT